MSEALKFFDGLVGERIANIHTCLPCRVIAFNGSSADVQPIPKRKLKDGREIIYPMLVKVPVIKRKYQELVEGIPETKVETPFYEKGDVVLVSFSSRDLSEGTIIGLLG